MEPKNTNTQLIPRSIFKGKNSDGTSFTANEWSTNSIDNTLIVLCLHLII
jgi:hypothetical protein